MRGLTPKAQSRFWSGRHRLEFESVGDEALEIHEVAGSQGVTVENGAGGDHTIGMGTAAAAGVVEKAGGLLGLLLGERQHATAEDGAEGAFLLAGVRAIAKLRPGDSGNRQLLAALEPLSNRSDLRGMRGRQIHQNVGIELDHDCHQ